MKPNNNGLYSSQEARWDTIFGEIEFLGKVRRAREEYEKDNFYELEKFIEWVKDNYGVKIIQNNNGITAEYEILDDLKFLIFNLKFSA